MYLDGWETLAWFWGLQDFIPRWQPAILVLYELDGVRITFDFQRKLFQGLIETFDMQ